MSKVVICDVCKNQLGNKNYFVVTTVKFSGKNNLPLANGKSFFDVCEDCYNKNSIFNPAKNDDLSNDNACEDNINTRRYDHIEGQHNYDSSVLPESFRNQTIITADNSEILVQKPH